MSAPGDKYHYVVDEENINTVAGFIVAQIPEGCSVLDLGCGSGAIAQVLTHRKHCRVTGVEACPERAALARRHCSQVLETDLESANLIDLFSSAKFDAVIAADLLEHLRSPQDLLRQIPFLLTPKGIFVASTPNIAYGGVVASLFNGNFQYRVRGLLDYTHLHFFTQHELECAILAAKLVPEIWKEVCLAPEHSEFSNDWSQLPAGVQDEILSTTQSLVYQWVVVAREIDHRTAEAYLSRKRNDLKVLRDQLSDERLERKRLTVLTGDLERQIQSDAEQLSLAGKKISELEQRARSDAEQLSLASEKILQLGSRLETSSVEQAHLNQALFNITHSTSWQAVTTLRKSLGFAVPVFRLLRRIRHLARRENGMLNLTSQVRRVLVAEGISGITKRMRALSVHPLPAPAPDYAEWIRRYDQFDTQTIERLRQVAARGPSGPLISIVMPVFDPKPEWLEAAIQSVLDQTYPHWQLCITDDASHQPEVRLVLNNAAEKDDRVKVAFRPVNGHISAASNSALELVKGQYIGMLDHDDVLPCHALQCVADAIRNNPRAVLIYSDEDKLDPAGNRCDPHFKPDWNIDLLRSHNYICHFSVVRTEAVHRVGGFRLGYEGAQDYDLFLRVAEHASPDTIIHIPRILYHWRKHPESASANPSAKPYATKAAERALNDHLSRCRIHGVAKTEPSGHFHVTYFLPKEQPSVTIIIPTKNRLDLLRRCVESILLRTEYRNYTILIIDNGSDEKEIINWLAQMCRVAPLKTLRDERSFNFSAMMNLGARHSDGEFLVLLNNDTEVLTPEWLSEMVGIGIQEDVGAVGARLWYPDDTLQHGGCIMVGGVAGHAHKHLPKGLEGYFKRAVLQQSFSAVTGACLLVRKAHFLEAGGFDEENLSVAFNDIDFCLKLLSLGYRNVFAPKAEFYHHESASRGLEDTVDKRTRFDKEVRFMQAKWAKIIRDDPAYNPNLTCHREDFSLAFPPRVNPLL